MINRQPGLEPIPGFKLTKRLGRGGFGEVWKASAPGGTEVALKFIPLAGKHGLKEFRGLQLVKRIRHANLLPLIAIWLVDEHGVVLSDDSGDTRLSLNPEEIVIAMSLGDKSLSDRLKECKQAGQPGIPANELLGYMEDAAKAIDFLNRTQHDFGDSKAAIVHGDIKPQNILIVGTSVQVCDFGLARMLADVQSTATGITPAYASPEQITQSRTGLHSDQYALAITYCELRTGHLPFADTKTAAAMIMAHMEGKLDFARLPEPERKVIEKATALNPDGRYPTVQAMVRELSQAIAASGGKLPPPPGGDSDFELELELEPLTHSTLASDFQLSVDLSPSGDSAVIELEDPSRTTGSVGKLSVVPPPPPPSPRKTVPPPPPPAPPSPSSLPATSCTFPRACGPYQLQRTVGQGAMGIVYLARGPDQRTVAVKVLPGTRYANAEHVQRLLREARLGMTLRHPNLCSILDAGTHEGDFYLVMEYLEGKTLRAGLEERKALPVLDACVLGQQLIAALAYLAEKGVIHRDVKPANVMLRKDNVKLMDLGLAKNPEEAAGETRLTQSGFIMGTPAYMAPEQIQDASRVTFRSDLYSAGAVLYEVVTGKRPHESNIPFQLMRMVLQDPIVDPRQHRPDLPEPLARLLMRLLDKSPDARPDHTEAIRVLKQVQLGGIPVDESGLELQDVAHGTMLFDPGLSVLHRVEKVAEAVKEEIKDPNADELLDALRKKGGPSRLGNWIIEERIGPRAPITTYRAFHYLTKIQHLIRVLPPAFGTLAEDQLQALLDMQGQLQQVSMTTPQLCTLVEVNMAELPVGPARAIYFTAEHFLSGATIEQLIKDSKRLELKQAKYCLRSAIKALHALHRKKLVHGNVHPGKCYLNGDGKQLLMADLSRARRVASANGSSAGQADVLETINRAAWMGNPYAQRRQYIAPEIVVKNAAYDFLAEQYALGVTFIEALTGAFLRTHQNDLELMHYVHEDLEERLFEIDDRSVTLGRVLRRMVATKPQLRFQDLPSLLVTLTTQAKKPVRQAKAAAPRRRKPYTVFISYRRDPDAPLAYLLKEKLEGHGFKAFLDVEGLDSGPFPQKLLRYIEEAPHFVPIFSKDCLERCKSPDDWLRREITHAVQTDRHIVPLFMPSFKMPKPEDIPVKMRSIKDLQAVMYDTKYKFVDELVGYLRERKGGEG